MKPNLKRLMKVNTNTRPTTTSIITDNLISQNSVPQINKKIILEAGDTVATCPSLEFFFRDCHSRKVRILDYTAKVSG